MEIRFLSVVLGVLILIAVSIVPAAAEQSSNEMVHVIIGFKEKPDAALIKSHGGDIKCQYHAIPAIAATVPEQALKGLENNQNIDYIEYDTEVYISDISGDDPEMPWGVDRIDADLVHSSDPAFTGEGIKVAVIDTGIDSTHPDLAANYAGGYNVIKPSKPPMDDNGHGTHVSGTIAALDDESGVVGVAPDAKLYAVKALNREGSGYLSDVNLGIQWAIDNDMDLISMSLGGPYSESQEKMCLAAYNAGIVLVAAAGNSGGSVIYPAAYDTVIAVSATDSDDAIADFSSKGPEIELAAPGVSVPSTYLAGTYAKMSGTSMATPHVSGVVALLLSADVTSISGLDLDNDRTWDPLEVRTRLDATATDLGDEGKDVCFGNGLVNAYKALEGLSAPTEPVPNPVSSVTINEYSRAGNKFVWATATVVVKDSGSGNPIEGATVTGYWTINEVTVPVVSGITDSTGTVIFKSDTLLNPAAPVFNFEVTGITL